MAWRRPAPSLLLGLVLAMGCRWANPHAGGVSGPAVIVPAAPDASPAPAADASVAADLARPSDVRSASDIGADVPPGPSPDVGSVDAAAGPAPPGSPACANPPTGPIPTRKVDGIMPLEDITFDDSGNLYWSQEAGGIVKS